MLTGQTEGTDGGVTCPRSSGMPESGNEGFETQRFCAYLLFSLCFGMFSFHPLSPLYLFNCSLFFCSLALPLPFFYVSNSVPPEYRSEKLLYRLLPVSPQTYYPLNSSVSFSCTLHTFSALFSSHRHADLLQRSQTVPSYLCLLKSRPKQPCEQGCRKNGGGEI